MFSVYLGRGGQPVAYSSGAFAAPRGGLRFAKTSRMPQVPAALAPYVLGYVAATIVVVAFVVARSDRFLVRPYFRFLLAPWRLATFAIATALIAGAAPYSGDPTWDLADSLLCSVAVFVTAPWAIGTLARMKRHRDPVVTFAALVLFFVPCWTYDLYILFRDGFYPDAWLPNLPLSGAICFLAGLFWNLTIGEDGRPTFAFLHGAWLDERDRRFAPLLRYAALLSVPVVLMVGAFVYTFFA